MVREKAQRVKGLSCTDKDLIMIPRTYIKRKKKGGPCTSINPALGEQADRHLLGSLLGEFQAQDSG